MQTAIQQQETNSHSTEQEHQKQIEAFNNQLSQLLASLEETKQQQLQQTKQLEQQWKDTMQQEKETLEKKYEDEVNFWFVGLVFSFSLFSLLSSIF